MLLLPWDLFSDVYYMYSVEMEGRTGLNQFSSPSRALSIRLAVVRCVLLFSLSHSRRSALSDFHIYF